MEDYEDDEKKKVEIEKLNNSDFAKEHGVSVAYIVQILLCNQKTSGTIL